MRRQNSNWRRRVAKKCTRSKQQATANDSKRQSNNKPKQNFARFRRQMSSQSQSQVRRQTSANDANKGKRRPPSATFNFNTFQPNLYNSYYLTQKPNNLILSPLFRSLLFTLRVFCFDSQISNHNKNNNNFI